MMAGADDDLEQNIHEYVGLLNAVAAYFEVDRDRAAQLVALLGQVVWAKADD